MAWLDPFGVPLRTRRGASGRGNKDNREIDLLGPTWLRPPLQRRANNHIVQDWMTGAVQDNYPADFPFGCHERPIHSPA
jgi:hypothetical protein